MQHGLEKLQLPEWADNSAMLTVFHGKELVAYKYQGKPWMVKVDRCGRCGNCCDECADKAFDVGNNGPAICGIDEKKPFGCCLFPFDGKQIEGCNVTYKVSP